MPVGTAAVVPALMTPYLIAQVGFNRICHA
jgi:hypothetical protein